MPPVQVLLKTLVFLCTAIAVAASSPELLLPPSAGTWVARRAPPSPSAAAFAPLSSDTAKCAPLGVAGGAVLAGTTLDASLGASSSFSPLAHRPPPAHRLPPPSLGSLSAVAGGSGARGLRRRWHRLWHPPSAPSPQRLLSSMVYFARFRQRQPPHATHASTLFHRVWDFP